MESLLEKTGLLSPINNSEIFGLIEAQQKTFVLQGFSANDRYSCLIKFKCGSVYKLNTSDIEELKRLRDDEVKQAQRWGVSIGVAIGEGNELRRLKSWLRNIHDTREPIKV